MNLAELKAKGGFVALAPVAREVTWKRKDADGNDEEVTFTVHIRKHSFGVIEQIWSDHSDRSKSAAYIAQSVRLGDNGKDAMSYDDAYALEPSLASVLIDAINAVNGTGKVEPKN